MFTTKQKQVFPFHKSGEMFQGYVFHYMPVHRASQVSFRPTQEFLRPKAGPFRPTKGPLRSIKSTPASQVHIRPSQADLGPFKLKKGALLRSELSCEVRVCLSRYFQSPFQVLSEPHVFEYLLSRPNAASSGPPPQWAPSSYGSTGPCATASCVHPGPLLDEILATCLSRP